MASVETSIEGMITQINGQYFNLMTQITAYAKAKGWDLSEPDTNILTAIVSQRPEKEDVDYLTGDKRLFDPKDISGGFPVYQPVVEIDWQGLYDALITNKSRVWESAEMDNLIATMQGLILGDDAWLTETYQTNIFDKDRDRRRQILDDSLRLITSRYAARKFRVPTSMLGAQENEALLKYQYDNTNESRELGSKVIDAAKSFQQFAMEKGLSYEQINMGFTQAYNAALLEPIKLKVETYMKQVETAATVFLAKVKAIMVRIDAEKASWELTGTYNENLYKTSSFPWQIYKLEVDTAVEAAKIELEEFKTKVSADLSALVEGFGTMGRMVQTGSSITLNTRKV